MVGREGLSEDFNKLRSWYEPSCASSRSFQYTVAVLRLEALEKVYASMTPF
jgi:hypothetical protein